MCGRYTFFETALLYERFKVNQPIELAPPRYNVTPGSSMPVIIKQSPNQARLMKWGLVPAWAKDPQIGYRMINARAETIATKPAFRKALLAQRCLVPANGFYEWNHETKPAKPYYFRLKNQTLMALAGLYERFVDAENQELYTYTIITTAANRLVGQVHPRMPVIFESPMAEDEWLEPSLKDPKTIQNFLKTLPDDQMLGTPVSRAVNNPRAETPDLIKPEVES